MDDDGYSWFVECANGGVEKPTKPRKKKEPTPEPQKVESVPVIEKLEVTKPRKGTKSHVCAVGWCKEGEEYPSAGRAVEGALMAREDVLFDGMKITSVNSVGRYFGFVLVADFIESLKRDKKLKTVWTFDEDGAYRIVWSAP